MRSAILSALVLFSALHLHAQEAVQGIIILKVKREHAASLAQSGKDWQPFGPVMGDALLNLRRMYPQASYTAGSVGRSGRPMVDMTRTYRLSIDPQNDVASLARALSATGLFDWVETTDVAEAMLTPNDPNIANQNHLTLINAYTGWDETQGDTNVVIGITDTSFDLLHPDLAGNVKRNYADPVNGTDDDSDGFTDNFSGWDIFGNDNNLFFTNEWHGTGVAAVASATTDNGVGIAGVGFKCKFLPVKVGNDATSSTIITADGLEAIAYCADRGCKVINCSWGSVNPSQAGQDAVDYAVINKDACVVAAAGNVSGTAYYYPASYDNAVSVTGVHNTMLFNNGSNPTFTYNDRVDLCAQGFNVYTTATVGASGGNAVYSTTGGTSIAAPQVSGALALIRSKDTCLSALESVQLLLDSAINIDDIGTNSTYAGQIGKLIDIGAALSAIPCSTIGVNDALTENLLIFPNPNNGDFRVNVPFDGTMTLFMADGRVARHAEMDRGQRTVSGLAPGLYIVHHTDGTRTVSARVAVGY
jgi:serine protease